MMDDLEFSLWCEEQKFSELARKVMKEIRSSEPVRNRQSRVGNWTGRYASDKMGRTIQFESRTEEFPAIVSYEHDKTVLEFYDQPSKIEMRYMSGGERPRPLAFWHTPDFFILREDGAGWEEWKPQEKLFDLAKSMPNRYQRDEQGKWRCPPGESYAARYGLTYTVRTSAELNPLYLRNLYFLEDYLRDPKLQVDLAALKLIRKLFAAEPVMTLKTLLEHVEAQHIYSALLRKHIYIDLIAAPLADSEYVHVFRDEATAQTYLILSESPYQPSHPGPVVVGIGERIVWDGRAWTIFNHGDTIVSMRSDGGDWAEINRDEFYALVSRNRITQPTQKGQVRIGGMNDEELTILARATKQDLEEGNTRYRILQRYRSGETPEQLGTSYRTLRDWEVKHEKAEHEYGHGLIGLITHYQRSGNPQRKLPDASLEAMQKYIVNDYETDKQKSKVHSWGQMEKYCKENGIHAPTYRTYCKEIAKRGDYEQTLKRKGRRAAYQVEVPYLFLEYSTPRHGDFPWQIVHLDHGQPDIQLVSSRTKKVLGKPWETTMVDAYSRRTLAVYLSYDPPSYRSDMMVIRECVRRYKRLPQILVVDGGPDFNSTYFESLLAYYNITKFERPPAEPRAGSPIERIFGTTHSSFIYNLRGNTQASKQVREMTQSVDPRNKAVWTLSAFYRRLCQWCYDVYDTSFHSTLEQSPREEYEAGMALGGVRPYREIDYDKKFLMMTLPAPERPMAKVIYRKGVQVHYEFYWSEKFRDSEVVGTDVEIRYDPFDISRVFALVNGEWIPCTAANRMILRNHSERELQLISAELRRRQTVSAQQYQIRIKHIAEFLASVEAEELLGIQRIRDAESRDILQIIDPSYSDQFSLFQVPALSLDMQDMQKNDEDEEDSEDDKLEDAQIYGDYE